MGEYGEGSHTKLIQQLSDGIYVLCYSPRRRRRRAIAVSRQIDVYNSIRVRERAGHRAHDRTATPPTVKKEYVKSVLRAAQVISESGAVTGYIDFEYVDLTRYAATLLQEEKPSILSDV